MTTRTIWPICVDTMSQVEKSNLTYAQNQREKLDVCSLMYLLKGESN